MSASVPGGPRRRTVLSVAAIGAAGAATAGCQSYGEPTNVPDAGDPPAGQSPAADGAPLAQLADIPVGGGAIFAAAKVVLTRPAEDTVKAFSVACTHQGCAVSEVKDGTINCACHGSKFKVDDGSVTAGPANAPLKQLGVTVQDGAVRLA